MIITSDIERAGTRMMRRLRRTNRHTRRVDDYRAGAQAPVLFVC